jgi:hypothetical protein
MGSADGGEATARRLLEREGEIVALEDALGRAAAGSGSMVAFEGAAGLGHGGFMPDQLATADLFSLRRAPSSTHPSGLNSTFPREVRTP